MLEWTGERFLPWLAESTIGYEHLHRYRYAATLVTGKRVLDLASGEGYGSKILAETASSVVGVDIDENAICHATQRYGREALQFIIGSITAVPISENHSFDVIVCFEAIEHIEEQEKLLGEVNGGSESISCEGTRLRPVPPTPRPSFWKHPFSRPTHSSRLQHLANRLERQLRPGIRDGAR